MKNATEVTVSVFGALAGMAGIEHGIGEVLQGNVAPAGMAILSWPGSELFSILAGEPAMTVVPNLLATGVLAILSSLVFLACATVFVRRKNGGLVLILLSIVMLLVGGGFGPPILGIIVGVAGTRIDGGLTWWRAHLSRGSRHLLGALWPLSLVVGLAAWLSLMPGSMLVDHFFGVSNPELVIPVIAFSAFSFLVLAIVSGLARDVELRATLQQASG